MTNSFKSESSDIPAHVRFANLTRRSVDVYWLDYNGQKVKYDTLVSRTCLDVDTFVGHPWVFVDHKLQDDYFLVGGKRVFFPQQSLTENHRPIRKLIFILMPVYSLKKTCMRAILDIVPKDRLAELDIPSSVIDEMLS